MIPLMDIPIETIAFDTQEAQEKWNAQEKGKSEAPITSGCVQLGVQHKRSSKMQYFITS